MRYFKLGHTEQKYSSRIDSNDDIRKIFFIKTVDSNSNLKKVILKHHVQIVHAWLLSRLGLDVEAENGCRS